MATVAVPSRRAAVGKFYVTMAAIFVAIVVHKTTEGVALGVSLTRNRVRGAAAVIFLIVFACVTPIGIVAGSAAAGALDSSSAHGLAASLLAMGAGTFVYIASLDIITEEFTHSGDRVAKWCLAMLGLGLSAVLAYWL